MGHGWQPCSYDSTYSTSASAYPISVGRTEETFGIAPQTAANAITETKKKTNQKQNKAMKVKIKGYKELQEAIYDFDAGRLIGVVLAEDADNGVYNVYPMELVTNIYDD